MAETSKMEKVLRIGHAAFCAAHVDS